MRIELFGAHNTRDLGGLEMADGSKIRVHRLIRSGALSHITAEDVAQLQQHDLRFVIDFRTPAEQRQRPDVHMENVRYHTLPIISEQTMGVTREKNVVDQMARMASDSQFDAEKHMQMIYADFVRSDYCVTQLAQFFRLLAELPQNGAVLWHCTAGKDRVGMATALLLTILGASRETVLRDYMRTNDYVANDVASAAEAVAAKTGAPLPQITDMVTTLYTVKQSYLDSVFDAMTAICGSTEAYLSQKLGITDNVRKQLRKLYLEP